ncbi:hypothetical protein TNCV_1286441 [Trichonephila clavipes]|uniref:Uncharacterized protein n=1 Tax=Trichonephila clavipes TaxID=2585209 RepID=A0A8X6VPR4_TRICX|nr:hypothetical protein TNCV_1286441 [Trichonephila clavipes]
MWVCCLDGKRKKREIGMARKRAENREGSLGFPGFVKRVFTKDSKPLGRRKRSLGYLGERETHTHLKEVSPLRGPQKFKTPLRVPVFPREQSVVSSYQK